MENNNDKKALFHEMLTFLIDSANINNGTLTMEEIHNALKDVIDDDSMYQLVYDYLLENKITIKGYISTKKTTEESGESKLSGPSQLSSSFTEDSLEKNLINMYMDEISSVSALSIEDEIKLLEALVSSPGDKEIANQLVEGNLNKVLTIIECYKGKGVSAGDLIQEGNLGLMEGILTYPDTLCEEIPVCDFSVSEKELEGFHNHLTSTIIKALEDAILEQNTSERIYAHTVDRANELDRASIELSKKLDRTPTLEELAKHVALPEDEVERIMKMSLDALTINQNVDEK